jgi:aryl-alcohol dehydrogenase-like predicted oxidoreductase
VTRVLGRTGLVVSRVGLGAGPLGDLALSDHDAEALLRTAIDLGVRVIDTAPSYGASEDRIGSLFSKSPHLRDRVVLVTKGGYGVPGVPDWTPDVITRGIERALGRLCTDRIDVFLLHSCPPRDDLVAPLVTARERGRVRAIGYAGDREGLAWAASCDAFDVIECSVNLVDQHALDDSIPRAIANGKGVLAKRALANAAWTRDDHEYSARIRAAYPKPPEDAWSGVGFAELAIRFSAHAPGVASALVGTRSAKRLEEVVLAADNGPLLPAISDSVRARFATHAHMWESVI